MITLMAYVPDRDDSKDHKSAWRNKIYKTVSSSNVNEIVDRMVDCLEAKQNDMALDLHYHVLLDNVEIERHHPVLSEIMTFAKWRMGEVA